MPPKVLRRPARLVLAGRYWFICLVTHLPLPLTLIFSDDLVVPTTTSVAGREPLAVGVKVSETEQLLLAATVCPLQVSAATE
jgi:hypothetical protein